MSSDLNRPKIRVRALSARMQALVVVLLVMAGASRLFNDRDADFRLPIRFHFNGASLQSGFTLGFVIGQLTSLSVLIQLLTVVTVTFSGVPTAAAV